jgi:predicted ribosomally synthesized peptide with nif11-like leader
MSEQGLKAFKDKMGTDQAFKAGVLGEASIEGRMRVAQAAGFDCTADEIMGVAGLSDDQLDGVAGGCGTPNLLFNQSVSGVLDGSSSGFTGAHHLL